jgi:hypothetical protein
MWRMDWRVAVGEPLCLRSGGESSSEYKPASSFQPFKSDVEYKARMQPPWLFQLETLLDTDVSQDLMTPVTCRHVDIHEMRTSTTPTITCV